MNEIVFIPGGAVVDERVCLDEGAADDTRGAGELRADRQAAVVMLGGAGTSAEAAGLLLLQRKYYVIKNCNCTLFYSRISYPNCST